MSITPEPWTMSKCKCGDPICKAWGIDHSNSNGMFTKKDAQLIIAAPRMLKALRAALRQMAYAPSDDDVGAERSDAVRAKIKAAIAEATKL